MKNRLNSIAQRMGEAFPYLRTELENACIQKGVVEYLSEAVWKASASALLAFAASALIFTHMGRPYPTTSILAALTALGFVLFIYLKRPAQIMKSRASRIERSLIFSLHAINIEMSSGIKFPQAIEDVAEKEYGEFSLEMRRVLEDTCKHGLRKALEQSARRNPSKIYRRVVWQIINSLETGADMHSNIQSIIEDLRRKQEDEAQRYGRSMEKQLTVYVMGGIVFPALAVVIIQTTTTFGVAQNMGGERLFWAVLMFSALVQVLFIYMIKFKKPTLMGESLIKRQGGINPITQLRVLLDYAGMDTDWRVYVLKNSLTAIGVGIVLTIIIKPYSPVEYPFLLVITTIFAQVTIYTHLVFAADKRGFQAAEYLPDSLRMMAANLEAGIAIDQALFMSARSEFGTLGEEIKLMATDMIKNRTFEEALQRLKKRIKSEPLHMSVNLVSHGLRAGRGLSTSLYHIADILQDREYVRQAVGTQLAAIRTMVIILVVLSAPLLYSTSIVAETIMTRFNEKLRTAIPADIRGQSWLKQGDKRVSPEFLNGYFMANILVTSLLGSIILGEVTTGQAREGLRYMFVMVLTSEAVYTVLKTFMMERIGGVFV